LAEHALLNQRVERVAINDLTGGVDRALDRDIQNIIVSVAEGVVTFSVQARVLIRRECVGVEAMRGGKAIAPRQSHASPP